ncbi:MAG TPA: hypothetical protein VMZ74_16210 [Ramlibacter sp.]|nr:hypothetical protein [Ramlibacter sp.]
MNTAAQHKVPQQLTVATRAGTAFVAVALIAGGMMFAGQASENAVHNAQVAMAPAIRYVVLQDVEVVAKKQPGDVADTACTSAQLAKQI